MSLSASEELAYRIRAGQDEDEPELKQGIGVTMARPARKRTSYRGAVERSELLVLEQYDRRDREWRASGFVEYRWRVDDTVTIKDAGSVGDAPRGAVIKHLINELLRGARGATAKVRSDATDWNELLNTVPGFSLEGKEYRRPHYYLIWQWSPELAGREARRAPRGRRMR